jgi:phosphopantetheinyl transferase
LLHNTEEYKLIWWENEINFYRLWTIKESVIKLNLSWMDNLDKIKISKILKKNNILENINFDLEIYWNFENKNFICYNWVDWGLVYSVSYFY